MKILLSSYAFSPSIGGIEAVSSMLADEFVIAGHELKVVTLTPTNKETNFPYEVARRPGSMELFKLIDWSEVVLHVNISLHTGWPLLFKPKPWVISHHTWVPRNVRGIVKRHCTSTAYNISISQAVAQSLDVPSVVIPNPYDQELFQEPEDDRRDRDLIFVGRLVSQKGVDCALKALSLLKKNQVTPNFTVVGAGPEEPKLRELTHEFGLEDQVNFVGMKRGPELVRELARHRILVVPTVIEEPFGVVALEGIACGCVVVGSSGGGLKDAIGPCGVTFLRNSAWSLADSLIELLRDSEKLNSYRMPGKAHLAGFAKPLIAQRYLDVMQSALNSTQQSTAA
jgi:glycosyltransferase involved in cell wall biosynthesis